MSAYLAPSFQHQILRQVGNHNITLEDISFPTRKFAVYGNCNKVEQTVN